MAEDGAPLGPVDSRRARGATRGLPLRSRAGRREGEEERRLRAWDFVHCPPQTEQIFVGAGAGPCVVLMAGARSEADEVRYPVSQLAARHGAGVQEEMSDPKQAHARFKWSRREKPSDWERLPWASPGRTSGGEMLTRAVSG